MNPGAKKIFFFIPIVIVVLDRVSKLIVVRYLKDLGHPVRVIPECFNLVYSENRGALFGAMGNFSDPLRFILLTLFPLIIVAIIIVIMIKASPDEKILSTGMSLILGGAVGNLIDRFYYRHVVDFLDFYIDGHHWHTFNLADSCITVGIILIFFEMLVKRR